MRVPDTKAPAGKAPAMKAPARHGFTLVELLVVMAIIAVLAGLATVGVMSALTAAKQTTIKMELDQIDSAMKAYREKYGSYPPCDLTSGNQLAITSHVARVFPRYYDLTQVMTDIGQYVDTVNFRPDQALVFWLGGFNPDPTRPFLNLNNTTLLPKAQRTAAIFSFDPGRLVVLPPTAPATQCASYYAQGSKTKIPYVYFDAGKYGSVIWPIMSPLMPPPVYWDATIIGQQFAGVAAPYANDVNKTGVFDSPDDWVNSDSFQIIGPGLDEKFGSTAAINSNIATTVRLYPAGNPANASLPNPIGYDPGGADDDNVANFCVRARLGDARP
jgi:prepilin-type N-terminal cleavage/methylation domain-containing protein